MRWALACTAAPTSNFAARLEIRGIQDSQLQSGQHFIQVTWTSRGNGKVRANPSSRSPNVDAEQLQIGSLDSSAFVFQRQIELSVGRTGYEQRVIRLALFRTEGSCRPLSAGSTTGVAGEKDRRAVASAGPVARAADVCLGEIAVNLGEYASAPGEPLIGPSEPLVLPFPTGTVLAGASLLVSLSVTELAAGAECVELPLSDRSQQPHAGDVWPSEVAGSAVSDVAEIFGAAPDGDVAAAAGGADASHIPLTMPTTPPEELPSTPRVLLSCSRRFLLDPMLFRRKLDAAVAVDPSLAARKGEQPSPTLLQPLLLAASPAEDAAVSESVRGTLPEGQARGLNNASPDSQPQSQPQAQPQGGTSGAWWTPWGARRAQAATCDDQKPPRSVPHVRSHPLLTAITADQPSPRKRARPPTPDGDNKPQARVSESALITTTTEARRFSESSCSGKTRRESLSEEVAAMESASPPAPAVPAPAMAADASPESTPLPAAGGQPSGGEPEAKQTGGGRWWWQRRPPRADNARHRRSASAPMDLEVEIPSPQATSEAAGATTPPSKPIHRRVQTEEDFERDLKMVMEVTAAIAEGRHVPAAVQLLRPDQKRQRGSSSGNLCALGTAVSEGHTSPCPDSPPGSPLRERDGGAAARRITEEGPGCSTPLRPLSDEQSLADTEAETPLVLRTASLELSPFRSSRVEVDGGEWLELELRDPLLGEEAPIRAEVFFGSIDQCSGAEGEAGTGACSVLAICVSSWLVENPGRVPTGNGGAELDELVRQGSRTWREMWASGDLSERFLNGHFDLESVLAHELPDSPLRVTMVPSESFVTFVRPPTMAVGECRELDFLTEGSLLLESVFDELRKTAPATYVVAWNDHFFVLKVMPTEVYLIDTLGERLYEGNRRAYILLFDDSDGRGGTAMAARFIRDFVGAAPLGQLAEDLKVGGPRTVEASEPERLMRRTQIEFHFIRRLA